MKKKVDYRAWAKKHFRDHLSALPQVSGAKTMHGKTYTYDDVEIKKERKYKTHWQCYCGTEDDRANNLKKIIRILNNESFVGCPRCTSPMKLKRIEENLFIRFYLLTICLYQNLRKGLVGLLKKM